MGEERAGIDEGRRWGDLRGKGEAAFRGRRPRLDRFLFLPVLAVFSPPAYAKTGNFLPMLASLFVGVPALLLLPAIAIGLSRPGPARKRPWIVAALALAVLAFGSLWWAVQTFHLMASAWWPSIYLWAVPGFFLWFAFRHANK